MNEPKNIKVLCMIVSLLVILTLPTYGQKIELYTGALYNNFYDWNNNDPHYSSDYSNKWGYSVGIAIDSLKFEWHTLRIGIQYDNYSGNMFARSGGQGGSYSVDGQIQKGIISLSIYPINIRRLIKRMQISIGFTGSILIHESFSGDYNGWIMGQGESSGRIEDKYDSYSSNITFGIQSLINYRIPISYGLEIVPQYSFYFGLSKELKEKPREMKSNRHYFLLGLRKKIK